MSQSTVAPGPGAEMLARGLGRGLRWRLVVSIVGPVAWLIFTLLYVGFWATGFTLFQSVIVILVSVLALGGLMGGVWVAWGPWPRSP